MNLRAHAPSTRSARRRPLRPVARLAICATALTLAGTLTACSSMMAAHNRWVEDTIVTQGEYDLQIESAITDAGLEGMARIDGCAEVEREVQVPAQQQQSTEQSANGEQRVRVQNGDEKTSSSSQGTVTRTETETYCRQFPARNALIRVVAGDQEIAARTDEFGRFRIDQGAELARLLNAGTRADVVAEYRGRRARTAIRLGGLDNVAALRLLDEMEAPSTLEIQNFVGEWRGTEAAELALARHGERVCESFRAEWNVMMSSGDIARINAIDEKYGERWQETFCPVCTAECAALEALGDLSAELGSLGSR